MKHTDALITRQVIMSRTGWKPALFGHKLRGIRGMTENEEDIIEATFRNFGLNAWSGNAITESTNE